MKLAKNKHRKVNCTPFADDDDDMELQLTCRLELNGSHLFDTIFKIYNTFWVIRQYT